MVKICGGVGLVFLSGMCVCVASAARYDLATFFFSQNSTGDEHSRSLTVGTPYKGITPADGTAIVSGSVGIGTFSPAPGSRLHIVGTLSNPTLILQAVTGQISNLEEFRNSTGITLLRVGPAGDLLLQPTNTGIIPLEIRAATGQTNDLFRVREAANPRFVLKNTGRVGIGTEAPNSKLVVQGSTTNNTTSSLDVTDSAASSLLFVRDDGRVGLGTRAPLTQLHLVRQDPGDQAAIFDKYQGGGSQELLLRRARGTLASPARVNNGDVLGSITAQGYDGSAFRSGGSIQFTPSNNWNTGDSPTDLTFSTTPGGLGGAPTERMRITNTGNVGLGTANPQAKLEIQNPGGTALRIVDGNQLNGKVLTSDDQGNVKWRPFPGPIAVAFRKDGPGTDTGVQAIARPIIVVRGTPLAFIAINNKGGFPGSLTATKTTYDGFECNAVLGWQVIGCWNASADQDSDLVSSSDGNGCITNDFDQRPGAEIYITCVKTS